MNKKEIDRKIWNRLYSLALNIDPIELIGGLIVQDENRPLTKDECRNVKVRHYKILEGIQKKSKTH